MILAKRFTFVVEWSWKNMYFHPKMTWASATNDFISRNHSNWPSLNLSQNLREGWTNSYWKHQSDVLSSRKKKSEKPNPTPNPLVRPRVQSQDLVSTNFDIKDILFGHFCSDDDDSILVNYIILESKYLIFRSKLSRSPLSTSLLCAKCIKKHT